MNTASASPTASARSVREGEPAGRARCRRPARRAPARRSASRPCCRRAILPASLSTQTTSMAELGEAGAGHESDIARADHRDAHALSLSAGGSSSARVSRRGVRRGCSATATLASRKPEPAAAIVALAGEAQRVERLAADHPRHGVGELDLAAGARSRAGRDGRTPRAAGRSGRSAPGSRAPPRAWASRPGR